MFYCDCIDLVVDGDFGWCVVGVWKIIAVVDSAGGDCVGVVVVAWRVWEENILVKCYCHSHMARHCHSRVGGNLFIEAMPCAANLDALSLSAGGMVSKNGFPPARE